jgi:hypothetical protein
MKRKSEEERKKAAGASPAKTPKKRAAGESAGKSARAKRAAGDKNATRKKVGRPRKSGDKKAPAAAGRQKELAAELTQLRANFVDIIGRYKANQEAQLLACIENLAIATSADQEAHQHADAKIVALLDELRQLRIKPEKGRLKDVRRIDALVKKIYAQLVATS